MSEKTTKTSKKDVAIKSAEKRRKVAEKEKPIPKSEENYNNKQKEGDQLLSADAIIENSPYLKLLKEEELERKHLIFLYLFEKSLGNISSACKAMNISRGTYYLWRNDNEKFFELTEEVNEYVIDLVEDKLKENIMNNKEISILFYLKTKGKHRGYVERIENDNKHEVVGFEFTDVNAEKKMIGN